MDRKSLYQEIKKFNLQNEVVKRFNKNFTRCSNDELQTVLKDSVHTTKSKSTPKSTAESKFLKLIEVLRSKRILLRSEILEIMR